MSHFLTPMQRADLNTGLIRQSCGQWGKKVPDLDKLVLHYGNRRVRKQDKKMLDSFRDWAEASCMAAKIKGGVPSPV